MKLGLAEVIGRDVPRETFEKLELFESLVVAENAQQNLVSRASLPDFWNRHIIDSAQLIRFAPRTGRWIDLGSGAGMPGLVVAIIGDFDVTLVEPRRLRAEFLAKVVDALNLSTRVCCTKAELVTGNYDVISARAVAGLSRLLKISRHLSTGNTVWVLPKGKSAQSELAEARRAWQAAFHVERSLTDRDSSIIVARNVRPLRR